MAQMYLVGATSVLTTPPSSFPSDDTDQTRVNVWSTVIKKGRKGASRHNTHAQFQPSATPTTPTTLTLPRLPSFQRGLSDTYDGLSLAKDAGCRSLLTAAKSDSDRLDAVILAALMPPDCPEMFLGAPATLDMCDPPAIIRICAHRAGDLHTALAVVRQRLLTERNDSKVAPLTKWAQEHGVNTKALKYVLSYIRDFRALWDYDDDHKDEGATKFDPVLDAVCNLLQKSVCVYRGHPALGYRRVSDGENVVLCPASAVHCLVKLPKYVVVLPRHMHKNRSGALCHHIIPLDVYQAEFLIRENYPAFSLASVVQVSLVPHFKTVGRQCLQRLCKMWNTENLQQEVQNLCDNEAVVLDPGASYSARSVRIYTSPRHHDIIQGFITRTIKDIQASMVSEKAELCFPTLESNFHMVLGKGLQCQEILFPYQVCDDTQDLLPLNNMAKSDCMLVKFKTDIGMRVQIGDVVQQARASSADYDHVFRSKAVVKRLFMYLNESRWDFTSVEKLDSAQTELEVVFRDPVSASNALEILAESDQLGVPITVLNANSARRQMASFELHLDKNVMRVLERIILPKLVNHCNRSGCEYKVVRDCEDNTLVQVAGEDLQKTSRVMDVLRRCAEPSASDKFSSRVCEYLTTASGQYLITATARQTNCYIQFLQRERCVLIYGDPTAKRQCYKLLDNSFKFNIPDMADHEIDTSITSPDIWYPLGRLHVQDAGLPSDFFIMFLRNTSNLDQQFTQVKNVHVDMHGEVWLYGNHNNLKQNRKLLCVIATTFLKQEYGMKPTVYLDQPKVDKDQEACVACYCTDPGARYVLGSCGHVYCVSCLRTQVSTAVGNTVLPLACAECDQAFVVADMENIVYQLHICSRKKLLKTALQDYTRKHAEAHKACTQPNCAGVTRLNQLAQVRTCGVCTRNMCPSCLHPAHCGMTCQEYEASVLTIERWMKEQRNRKVCSSCGMGIEKYDGCNNVMCAYCKKHLCWVCLEVFVQAQDCYNHLDKTGHWTDPLLQ